MSIIAPFPSVSALLLADAVIGRSSWPSLARLLTHVSRKRVGEGELIYCAQGSADTLYLLIEGAVRLVSPQGRHSANIVCRFGEEAASDCPHYVTGAIAASDAVLLCIPRAALRELVDANPLLKTDMLFSLTSHLAGENLARHSPAPPAQPPSPGVQGLPGWLLAIVLPLLILAGGPGLGLAPSGVIFLAIFTATIVMWVCSLVDDYIPPLFALLATLLTGLVPVPVILSGFASDGFLMALSTLALGTLVASSGLGYRAMLVLLHRLPNTQFWHNVGLFLTGLVLTPIIPTANGRIALLAPFYADMVESLRLPPMGSAATRLALSCFGGCSLFSAIFITSKSVNFVVFGLLSPQGQDHFQWMAWFLAASVSGAVLLLIHGAAAALYLRNVEQPLVPKMRLAEQRALLGSLTNREWAAILGIAFMLVGIVTSSIHKMAPPWLGFAMLFGLLLCGTINKKELKEKVDWTFLLYLSGITGIVAAFNHLGLDRQLGAALPDICTTMRSNFGLFVLLLFVLVNLMRLAVPTNATAVILATVFMPLAQLSGVNEWVVGFIILLFAEAWFFPYQCSYYLPLQQMNLERPMYDERRFLRLNAAMNLGRLLAVYAALPYWNMLGIL